MIKRTVIILLLIAMAAISRHAQAAQQTKVLNNGKKMSDQELTRAIERFIEKLVAEDKFSGAALVAADGVAIFKKAYGLASKGYNVPNRVDTKFNLGSMNKMFTGVAVAQLAEQGKLSFDDPVGKHLPDYSNKQVAEKVTVHQLLTHTSGMGSYFNDKFENSSRAKFREVRDYLPLFVDEPLQFEPGARWSYSNSGFMLLGAIVEKVSAQNYFDYIRQHIYKPGGMTNSDCYELDHDTPNLAVGYTRTRPSGPTGSAEWRNNIFMHVIRGGPAGGGYSTVEDLLSFAIALKQYKLLSAKYTDIVLAGKVALPGNDQAKYAYGFQEERVNGQRRVGHSGGFPGINAQLDMYPELGYIVAVMSNYDPPAANRVSERIGKLLTGAPIPNATTVAPSVLRSYPNRYLREGEGPGPEVVDIVLENADLWLVLGGQRHKFLPMSESEFFDEEFEDVRLAFIRNDKGEAISLKLEGAGPGTLIARKTALPPPSVKGNTTFRLQGYANARIVELTGSFNNWKQSQLLFARENEEWVLRLDLAPGKHTYKFIIDGESITDPGNPATENDGHGNINSVMTVKGQ